MFSFSRIKLCYKKNNRISYLCVCVSVCVWLCLAVKTKVNSSSKMFQFILKDQQCRMNSLQQNYRTKSVFPIMYHISYLNLNVKINLTECMFMILTF